MKNYEKPTVETVKFNDVITTSNGLSTVDSELLGKDNGNFDISWND
jgi:hypothetical protein